MGGKISKKKKGYDVSDTKEKQDGDANNIETKSATLLSEQIDGTVDAGKQATLDNSTEPTGEASTASQEVVPSQAPTTEGTKVETDATQEKTAAVMKEATPSVPVETQEPKEPSSGSEPQVNLETPALKKADEPKVTEEVVTPSPQAPETQVIQENPAPIISPSEADVVVEPVSMELDTKPPVTAPETSTQVKEATAETTVIPEPTIQTEAVIPAEQCTAVTNEIATGTKPTTESETVLPEEAMVTETVVHSPKTESTTMAETVMPSEPDTVKWDVSTTQKSTSDSETVIPLEQASIVEVSTVQKSTTVIETITPSENAAGKTVDVTTVQECTVIPFEQASVESVGLTTVQKSTAETVFPSDALETRQESVICETTESLAKTVEEHVTYTEILEPTQVPPPLPEELPEVTTTDEDKTESTETKLEAEVKDKSDDGFVGSEPENIETGLSSQVDVPGIALNSENTEAAVTEVVPEIVISESVSTNEFPSDEVKESVTEKEVMESAAEGRDQEPVVPSVVPEVNTQVEAPDDVPTSDCGTALVEEVKVENGEHEVLTPELNGETKATESVVETSQNEECVNGISSADGTPKEEHVKDICDLKKDLTADTEVPTVTGDMASAINATTNEVDLV
ncbi:cell surface glycoprotein 1 [Brienomyrus brachyistius]|uniref:cell surface glycoprotein 1 n=1 Tax=Brienomyrus brachyistius TaxID=42636 RepID=UPI0020B27F9E|nr:cell surface glycoprotein 1 [Brienomyrus brachyistius]